MKTLRLGPYKITMPDTARGRVILGVSLIIGGLLGALPVLGFWMLPLGILVLAIDSPSIRRLKRRMVSLWGRFWRRHSRK